MYATRRAVDGVAVSTLRVDIAAIRIAHLFAGIALDLRDPKLAHGGRGHHPRPRHPAAA